VATLVRDVLVASGKDDAEEGRGKRGWVEREG
jgi:hypothetical protein